MNKFMKLAFDEAVKGMESGDGGPFGAVIVNSETGEVVSIEHNRVLATQDPTMHAEISAIRAACAKLGRFSLSDCEIYSTCKPCPMCLGAIMWAKIPKLYYGTGSAVASKSGFDDEYMYEFIENKLTDDSKLSVERLDSDGCKELFVKWNNKIGRNMY